jgi:putative ABC transport system permease protein
MTSSEFLHFTFRAIAAHRLRSALTALGIAIGVTAVVLLTSIGSGIHQFVLHEFTQFGTRLIGVTSGRANTLGASVGMFGNTHPLTLADAEALARLPQVIATEPIVVGNASIEGNSRQRRANVQGTGPRMPEVFQFGVALGRYLPFDDLHGARAYAVLGEKVSRELFAGMNPLGETVRIGGDRFRVIGVMEAKGQFLGFDLDDTVYIPVSKALQLFNRDGLMEIDVLYQSGANEAEVVKNIKQLLIARHGREDFGITTQQQMMEVLGSVLGVLTFAIGALGGISLLVGGVGILTIMTIAVHERTAEIGLLRAIGAGRGQVLLLFLGEAVLLSASGGLLGLALGLGVVSLLWGFAPGLPVAVHWGYAGAAEALSALIGLVAGVLPAQRAAGLDPVEALRAE